MNLFLSMEVGIETGEQEASMAASKAPGHFSWLHDKIQVAFHFDANQGLPPGEHHHEHHLVPVVEHCVEPVMHHPTLPVE